MFKVLRNSMAAMALGATVIGGLAATPALARDHDRGRHDNGRHRGHDKHWDKRGRDRVVVVRERRAPPRVVYAYDWNRPDPRYGGYYAERYYRGGYAPVRVTRETRIYRGHDNRYYCRRSDGTTGLIVGAAVGGLLGDRIDQGRSSILGAVIGAGAGALIGKEIDSGQVQCR
ncbi:MAG TPA: glycine zipper 2TM domain-containing protein [Sphingobium sp.]|nr:glycine zipper 2TM domain-containing protein [Sphingobium sp.]